MNLRVIRTDWSTHKGDLLSIRLRVFVEEQGVPIELEHDEHDKASVHLLALADGAPVGTARMLGDGHIGRMAVLPDLRGRGIGTAMLRQLLVMAVDMGISRPFLYAQCRAIPFYERLGFVAEGEVFQDAGIDHRIMRIPLLPTKG